MIYENYGMRFVRLREEHLELLRYWRNHNSIQQYMEYKTNITAEMQREWFNTTQNLKYLYLLVEYNHNFIGLINVKEIDFKKQNAESGIFIWDVNFHNTEFPIRSILAFADFVYLFWNLKCCYATILNSNKKSIDLNKSFGYELVKQQPNASSSLYKVEANNFFKNTKYFKKHYKKVFPKQPKIIFQPNDFKNGWANYYIDNFCNEEKKHEVFEIETIS